MKGLAVQQIVLLVLGVVVLALIGFLLYSNYLSSAGQLSKSECLTIATNACKAILPSGQSLYTVVSGDPLLKCQVNPPTNTKCSFDPLDPDPSHSCAVGGLVDCNRVLGK